MLRKNISSLICSYDYNGYAKPFKVKSMEEQIGNNGEILSVNTLGKKCFIDSKSLLQKYFT